MMYIPWFFHEDLPQVGATVVLDAAEARHASSSKRLKVDDDLALFDGAGTVAKCCIVTNERAGRRLLVRVDEVEHRAPLSPAIHVAAALPKGVRTSNMLNMLAQLGVASVRPLRCAHGGHEPGRGQEERARRVFIEACKQCRTPYLPTFHDTCTPAECCQLSISGEQVQPIIMEPGSPVPAVALADCNAKRLMILIGPEGDFTTEERAACKEAGAIGCGLGPTILRIETAATVAAGAVRLVMEHRASGDRCDG